MAWSPDGERLAAGTRPDHSLRLWRRDGIPRTAVRRGQVGDIRSVAWHPDGSRIAVGGTGGLPSWELDGTPIPSTPSPLFKGHTAAVRSVAWNHEGTQLISGSDDKTVRLWNADGSPQTVWQGHEQSVTIVAWGRGGHIDWQPRRPAPFLAGRRDGRPGAQGERHQTALAWHPDGQNLAAGMNSQVQ